ncbi:hypothetical protein [Brevundimonas sp.]|uniref:hypothetical protein n=1 Tax=Brevundimonas sp. TaxID=1871086 RepID=UPI002FC60165
MSELSGEMLFGIMSMMLALVLWVRVLMNKRHSDDWLEDRLVERQEKIENQRRKTTPAPAPKSDEHTGPARGPWG